MIAVFHSHTVEMPLPDKHAFPQTKYARLLERVQELADTTELPITIRPVTIRPVTIRPGPPVTEEHLLRVHTADYIDRVFRGALSEKEQREIGFPWSELFVQRSLHSTGSTLAAARHAVAQQSAGIHLAGGTHHAFADRGQGFCVFNDVAVAIRTLQAERLIERALVLDCDVHQGNGTARLFANDPSVYTFSIHGAKNFPLKKEQSDLDVPLPDACEDAEYLERLEEGLDKAFAANYSDQMSPDIVFYISGADPYEHDKYGRMKLTKAGLRERDKSVFARLKQHKSPVTLAMGGGYARKVDDIADIYAATVDELLKAYA